MSRRNLRTGNATIYDTLSNINTEKFLPAIQRKFVWDNDQITKLFDSILRDYPIGTFLYWKVNPEDVYGKYTFYDFIKNYDERNPNNAFAKSFGGRNEIIGVLDGQQRMSALYIGICGSIARKRKGARQNNPGAYEKTELYFNALSGIDMEEMEEEGIRYEFKFLSQKKALEQTDNKMWIKVSDVYNIGDYAKINPWLNERGIENSLALENLNLLANKLLDDENVINYFEITSKTMDEILDIFVRVNSGGDVLTKGDLLFSTIVSQWDEGREKIDNLIKELNGIGQGFNFGVEEIITSCLYLMDLQTTLKVENLSIDNINKIKNEWDDIENALRTTVEIISDIGYCEINLTTKNALFPLVYYVYKSNKTTYDSDMPEMKKYLLIAQSKGVFHARTNQVLNHLRNMLTEPEERDGRVVRRLRKPDFRVEYMVSPEYNYLVFDEDDLQDLLCRKKGSITFAILTILDSNFLIGEKVFHQDHCHPHALLTTEHMMSLGLSREDAKKCEELRDQLPNLQILEGRKNERKSKEDFSSWYDRYEQKQSILCLPQGISYETKDFLGFFEARRILLEAKLRELFDINKPVGRE